MLVISSTLDIIGVVSLDLVEAVIKKRKGKTMSWKIQITQAKPNPKGKDKTAYGIPIQEQLLGEWVDLKNVGDQGVAFSRIHLSNATFSGTCGLIKRSSIYWSGKSEDLLKPGGTVRVHTGKSAFSSSMNTEDKYGTNWHAYAEKGNFVLNNLCGDIIGVWWKDSNGEWQKEDEASYSPNPPEGQILKRSGSVLIPSYATI